MACMKEWYNAIPESCVPTWESLWPLVFLVALMKVCKQHYNSTPPGDLRKLMRPLQWHLYITFMPCAKLGVSLLWFSVECNFRWNTKALLEVTLGNYWRLGRSFLWSFELRSTERLLSTELDRILNTSVIYDIDKSFRIILYLTGIHLVQIALKTVSRMWAQVSSRYGTA